jgi:hypothetical protein
MRFGSSSAGFLLELTVFRSKTLTFSVLRRQFLERSHTTNVANHGVFYGPLFKEPYSYQFTSPSLLTVSHGLLDLSRLEKTVTLHFKTTKCLEESHSYKMTDARTTTWFVMCARSNVFGVIPDNHYSQFLSSSSGPEA